MNEQLTKVRLLGRLQIPGGAMFNPGEGCAFAPDIAADLIRRGIAEIVETQEESEMPAKKALEKAPVDKMIKFAPNKGGKR